jgi:D-tyrosyl-tRNA(Tyr) deacylase
MKIVLQRVKHSSVRVNGEMVGSIQKGMMILLGVHKDDTIDNAAFLAAKCADLRIFSDSEGKMNLSLGDVNGEALVISQFTLLGNCTKGRRPSYIEAAGPGLGKEIYDCFVAELKKHVPVVATGIFGAMMDVELVNDGPVTLILEK